MRAPRVVRGGAHEHGYSAARRHSHDSDEEVMLPMPVTASSGSSSSSRGFLGCVSWNRRTLITVLTLVVITVFLFSLSGSAPAPSRRGIDEELRKRAGRGGTVLKPRDDDGVEEGSVGEVDEVWGERGDGQSQPTFDGEEGEEEEGEEEEEEGVTIPSGPEEGELYHEGEQGKDSQHDATQAPEEEGKGGELGAEDPALPAGADDDGTGTKGGQGKDSQHDATQALEEEGKGGELGAEDPALPAGSDDDGTGTKGGQGKKETTPQLGKDKEGEDKHTDASAQGPTSTPADPEKEWQQMIADEVGELGKDEYFSHFLALAAMAADQESGHQMGGGDDDPFFLALADSPPGDSAGDADSEALRSLDGFLRDAQVASSDAVVQLREAQGVEDLVMYHAMCRGDDTTVLQLAASMQDGEKEEEGKEGEEEEEDVDIVLTQAMAKGIRDDDELLAGGDSEMQDQGALKAMVASVNGDKYEREESAQSVLPSVPEDMQGYWREVQKSAGAQGV